MYQGVDVATTYHAFTSGLDINMRSLLGNVQMNKRANGGGSLTWTDVVAICRDHLSVVALVPTRTISRISTVIEKDVLGVMEAPSISKGGGSSVVEVPTRAA